MHADAVPLHKILNSNLQMIVPIFQREYSWESEPVKTLWQDILKLYDNSDRNESATHFLGPIVRAEVSHSSVDTRKFNLIDGQQRITTLMILLACVRNRFKTTNTSIVRKIESGYLLNLDESGDNKDKLLLSEGDRENFKNIVSGEGVLTESKLKNTYDFFTNELGDNSELDLEKLRSLIINKLILVSIDVDKDENPYLIFESLNAKGTPLTQADLIRNFIFMKIGNEDKQRELYNNFWKPMERSLGSELENFFWRYSLKDGVFVKINRTYANLKSELEVDAERSAESELKKLHEYSVFYERMFYPEREPNERLKERFIRRNDWEIGTSYPFLLNIYKDYNDNRVSLETFCEILDIIESFVIRRTFANLPTHKLNTLFIALYKKLNPNDLIISLKSMLTPDFPNDTLFREGIHKFSIYKSGSKKCLLILQRLEEYYKHKETLNFENLQIEHVMPRLDEIPENLPKSWKDMLGSDYLRVHSTYLHTLGNLTLTGYNPELSAKPFEQKRSLLDGSHLELNKYFTTLNRWDENEILKRANMLCDIAIKIWRYPNIDRETLLKYTKPERHRTERVYALGDHPHLQSEMLALFNELRSRILSINPDVREEILKLYIAYKASTNFVDIIPQKKRLRLSLNIELKDIDDPQGICKDVSSKGRWGNGKIEVYLSSKEQLDYVLPLIKQAYNNVQRL
jgi:uncharacterized protein with ParB-like and HNH nuclease domain/predicted transport protein